MDWTPGAAPEVTVWSPAEVRDEDEGEQEAEEEECDDWEEADGRRWGPGAAVVVTTEVAREDVGGPEQGGERKE